MERVQDSQQSTSGVRMREVLFDSGGVRCAADLYLPGEKTGRVPCVVMGHGGSGTKRLGLPAYAQKFAAGGLAALVFDYRIRRQRRETAAGHRRRRATQGLSGGGQLRSGPG